MPVPPLVTDAVFAGRYQILGPAVARSSIALYAAEHLPPGEPRAVSFEVPRALLGELRALLLLDPALVAGPADRERFEGRPWEKVNVDARRFAEILDAGIEGDTPWIAMKLHAGEDLATHLTSLDRGSHAHRIEGVNGLLEQIAAALSAAHDAGFVYGDLRPENVFVRHHDGVLLLGPGVAPLAPGLADPARLPWLAPEQIQADPAVPVGPGADVWAFGLLVFRVLTGHRYWQSEPGDELAKEISGPRMAASARARKLGALARFRPRLDAWFNRCVNPDPAARFPSVIEAFADLSILLDEPSSDLILANPKGSFYDDGLGSGITEPDVSPGNPAGPHYDGGLADASTSDPIAPQPGGFGSPYRDSLQRPPEYQHIVANPKGSHYDDGLSGRRRRPLIPILLALVAVTIAAILLARR